MSTLAKDIRAALRAHGDASRAAKMQAYMKSAMPYRGVTAPIQRGIFKEAFARHAELSCEDARAVAGELWREAKFREERYAAIALVDPKRRAMRACQTMAALPLYEEMIVTGAWWDFVDAIAGHHLGDILRAEPQRMNALMRRWSTDPHMWKRRASILCQLGFKHETDLDLLYACIEPNIADKDFFMRKAIGWALRQYAWIDPTAVRGYVKAHRDRLSPLSVREAMKNI